MKQSLERIFGMILRYSYLHKRSLPRTFEIVFWPVMELLVWGFVSVYLMRLSPDRFTYAASAIINGMIFWDILYRSQQGVSISFIEDIWTQNIINLLVSPLKIWEWILSTFLYSMLKTALITLILTLLAFFFYKFNLINSLHFYLIPLMMNLFLFGWSLGIFTSSLVIRWGHAAEALIWGVPFLIQPLSAIFYPLSVLPPWMQVIAKALPSTYVFEGMRSLLANQAAEPGFLIMAFSLNMVYFMLASLFFQWMYCNARRSGRLGRLGVD